MAGKIDPAVEKELKAMRAEIKGLRKDLVAVDAQRVKDIDNVKKELGEVDKARVKDIENVYKWVKELHK